MEEVSEEAVEAVEVDVAEEAEEKTKKIHASVIKLEEQVMKIMCWFFLENYDA